MTAGLQRAYRSGAGAPFDPEIKGEVTFGKLGKEAVDTLALLHRALDEVADCPRWAPSIPVDPRRYAAVAAQVHLEYANCQLAQSGPDLPKAFHAAKAATRFDAEAGRAKAAEIWSLMSTSARQSVQQGEQWVSALEAVLYLDRKIEASKK